MTDLRFKDVPIETYFKFKNAFYKKLDPQWVARIPMPGHFIWPWPMAVVEVEEPDSDGLYHWPICQEVGRSRPVRSRKAYKK